MSLLAQSTYRRAAVPVWLPFALVVVAAVMLRHIVMANADVSWGLTLADKWLDGARLYVDVIEVNPPATVFLYVLPAALARLLDVPAEALVDALVFLSIAASLSLCARMARAGGLVRPEQAWPLATFAVTALAILPAQTFGEREHIALITFMPLLTLLWLRTARVAPAWPIILAAGLGAGVTAIIKPYFVLAIVCAGAAAALSSRRWRTLFAPEYWIAATALAAYAAFVWFCFPVFVSDMMPMLAAVYVPVKMPLGAFVLYGGFPLAAVALIALRRVAGRDCLDSPISLLLAAAAGFGIAYLVQQKGWPYHAYPMLALLCMALGYALLSPRMERWFGTVAALAVAGATFFWMQSGVNRMALAPVVRAVAPHARILTLSGDLSVGHPITRQVGGVWVGRVPSLWVTTNVLRRLATAELDPATRVQLKRYADWDRAALTADIARNRPDIILVEVGPDTLDWLTWAQADPALAVELSAYRPVQTIGDVLILRRV